jgi:membrane protease subunit HflC
VQNLLRILVAAVIVLSIIAFMTTYTVRFTEQAVVTTFGKADESAVRSEPGLGFKWPYPVQSVTKYDTRARYVETRAETQGTADDRQIIVTAYLTWKVDNALRFYELYGNTGSRALDHFRNADENLKQMLRAALAEISSFNMTDLLSADAGKSKLAEVESRMLENIRSRVTNKDGGALKPLSVGIAVLRLPETTTKAVIDRMQATRNQLSAQAINSGKSRAEQIKVQAESDARTIMAFADRRASVIRAQGDQEAAQYYQKQNADPDLAVFLKNIEFMKQAMSKRTTLVFSLSEPGLGLLRPGALSNLKPGELPKFEGKPASAAPSSPATTGGR